MKIDKYLAKINESSNSKGKNNNKILTLLKPYLKRKDDEKTIKELDDGGYAVIGIKFKNIDGYLTLSSEVIDSYSFSDTNFSIKAITVLNELEELKNLLQKLSEIIPFRRKY